jgi:hypothetical protein
LCARGFVYYRVCCVYQIGSALSSVSMAPVVNACSSRRGAPTVFKSVWHVLDATLGQPGTAIQTRPRPGPKHARCRLRVERCVRVVLCSFECAACTRLVLRCPVSEWHPWRMPVAAEGVHQPSSNPFGTFWTPLWISPARQCRPWLGPKHAWCRLRVERCVRVVLCFMECAACFILVLG